MGQFLKINAIRVRFAVVEGSSSKARDGHMVSVELIKWDDGHPEPLVHIKDVLGYPGDPGVDIALIVQQHDLPTTWTNKALDQAASYSEQSVQDEISNRKVSQTPHLFHYRSGKCSGF